MSLDNLNFSAIGRRKRSRAKVTLIPGQGNLTINGREGKSYLNFDLKNYKDIREPLEVLGVESAYDVHVIASGGGLSGQSDSIKLGIARSLCLVDPLNRQLLKLKGLLTRDARIKERKKYGLKKARKASQFSKR
jgi:small subunit ribosomal protein S9